MLSLHIKPIQSRYKMTTYKCFNCDKTVKDEYIKKRVRCPYCGSKILFKPRITNVKVKAV